MCAHTVSSNNLHEFNITTVGRDPIIDGYTVRHNKLIDFHQRSKANKNKRNSLTITIISETACIVYREGLIKNTSDTLVFMSRNQFASEKDTLYAVDVSRICT